MELRKFCEYIRTLKSYRQIQKKVLSYPKILDVKYNELLENGKNAFLDHSDNIERWLDGKPCKYINPQTHQMIECKIGDDYEALYYFLKFCKMINQKKKVSEVYVDYLALLITRSNYPDWEEC